MKRRALTLMETLVCGLLISCVILSVVGLFVGCARAYRHSENQEAAGQMAEQALEQARAKPFPDLQVGRRSLPTVTMEDIEYRGTEEVSSDPTTTKLKRVRITVSWTYRNHPQQLVRESWLNAIKS